MSIRKNLKKKFLSKFLIIRPGLLNNLSFLELVKIPFMVNYSRHTPLCRIMYENGSDKAMFSGIGRHNYTPVYYAFFKKFMNSEIRLFEIGIGTTNLSIPSNMGPKGIPGASLRGWKHFFKNGAIFGADIDESILFNDDVISTFYCNQLDSNSIKNLWINNKTLSDKFDLIIDDGLHTFEANIIFLENSIHKLNDCGYYIIEDVVNTEVCNWLSYLSLSKIKDIPIKYIFLKIPNYFNNFDNNLIIIFKD